MEVNKLEEKHFIKKMKSNVGMITYFIMTREKVEKQGRDDHCELSHKTALHTVWLARTIVQHSHTFLFLRHEQFTNCLS